MSARPSSEVFWTISPMLIPASASGRKVRPATPGRSGTRADRHLRLAGVVGDARDDGLFEHVLLLDDPRALGVVERRADVDLHAVVASVLDRAQRQDAGAAAARSSISSYETCLSLRASGDDPRIGAVDAVDVGVDLADVGVERGRERDGGRVGAAAAERRDVASSVETPWKPATIAILPAVERLVDAAAAHLDDPGPAVARVGDDPGLRARERDRLVAEVVDRHRDERHRDPLAGGEEHVELARVRVGGDERGELDQLVGRVPHRRDDGADLVPGLGRLDDPLRRRA